MEKEGACQIRPFLLCVKCLPIEVESARISLVGKTLYHTGC